MTSGEPHRCSRLQLGGEGTTLIMDSIELNVEAYRKLVNIENGLRELLISELEASCGSAWWKQQVPGSLIKKAREGKKYESSQAWKVRIIYHPIYYLDFPELRQIIVKNDNWNHTFSRLFSGPKTQIEASLASVEPVRNRIAHTRVCSEGDLRELDRVQSLLESSVGKSRLEALALQPTYLTDGPATIDSFATATRAACSSVANEERLQPDSIPPLPPDWLIAELCEDGEAIEVRQLVGLLDDYRRIGSGQGSIMLIRKWPKRALVATLISRLGDNCQLLEGASND